MTEIFGTKKILYNLNDLVSILCNAPQPKFPEMCAENEM